jgi:hypothetical protein
MQRKRHRHRHARAGVPILCVGSAAHGHDHTDDRIGAGHLGGVFNAQRKSSGGLSIAPAMAECAHSKPWCSQTGLEPASPTRCALCVRHGLTADKALLAWRSPKLSYGRSIPKLTTSRRKCAPVSKRAHGCFHRKANFPTEKTGFCDRPHAALHISANAEVSNILKIQQIASVPAPIVRGCPFRSLVLQGQRGGRRRDKIA